MLLLILLAAVLFPHLIRRMVLGTSLTSLTSPSISHSFQNVFSARLHKDMVEILAEKSCDAGFGLHDGGCGEHMLFLFYSKF